MSNGHDRDLDNLHLTIFDWKNTKAIHKFSFIRNDKGTGPCADLPNTNYFHYAIQLNVYKYMLEQFYKDIVVEGNTYKRIVIDKMFLVIMHDNRDTYLEMLLPDYQERVRKMFEDRKSEVINSNNKKVV